MNLRTAYCVLVPLLAFALGFALFPLRAVGEDFDHLPGDLVDARLNNYVLEHGYRYLAGRESEFWHAPMFYPARRITAYSDAHLGMLPVYAALRSAGLSPESAFQGWFLIPFPLNFLAAAWALRRLGSGPWGSALGAYLFTFGLPLAISQLQHAQLGPRFLVPVALVLGWESAWRPSPRKLGWVAACVVGQTYLTLYIGYFLVLVLLVQWAVAAILFRRSLPWRELLRPGWRTWAARLGVALAAAVALLPLLIPHALAARLHDHYPVEVTREFCPTPESWVTPSVPAYHRDWADAAFPPSFRFPVEHQLFPGLLPIAAWLGGLALLARRPAAGTPAAAVGAAALVVLAVVALTTRFGEHAAYEPLLYVPGVGGMRVVGRIVLVLLFPLAVPLAAATDATVRFTGRLGWVAGALLLALLAADQGLVTRDGPRRDDWSGIRFPKQVAVDRRERLAEVIRRRPERTLVYVFPPRTDELTPELVTQLDAVWAAQQLDLPTVNGYSGYFPRGWKIFKDYEGLMTWLRVHKRFPEEQLSGLVVVGEPPSPGDDPEYERQMRARFPPLPRP